MGGVHGAELWKTGRPATPKGSLGRWRSQAMTDTPKTWMQTELGCDFFWDVRKLWAVDVPVVSMHVRELEWLLEKPFWKDGPGSWR